MKKLANGLNGVKIIATGFSIFRKLSLGRISIRFFKINDCHSSIGRWYVSKKYFFAKKLRRISRDSMPRKSESEKNGNIKKKWPTILHARRFWKTQNGYTKMQSVSWSSTASRTTCTIVRECSRCSPPSCLWSKKSRKTNLYNQPKSMESVSARLKPSPTSFNTVINWSKATLRPLSGCTIATQ